MDIGSGKGYPLSHLSTHSLNGFVFDGVKCASYESFLQSLKFDKPAAQAQVCALPPKVAKERGKSRDAQWRNSQKLCWNGEVYDRESTAYAELLERSMRQMVNQNPSLQKALIDTGDIELKSVGKSRSYEVPMTDAEFSGLVTLMRKEVLRDAAKKAREDIAASEKATLAP